MKVFISNHAADRYVDRVKPHLTRDTARGEIQRLLQTAGEMTPFCDYCEEEHFDAYIEIAPGISLALRHEDKDSMLAVTTIIRTGARPGVVEHRRRVKKKRKQRSRAQKRHEQIARRRGEARPEEGK
jgi:hypothetical protein